jgi:hypothetical protein
LHFPIILLLPADNLTLHLHFSYKILRILD